MKYSKIMSLVLITIIVGIISWQVVNIWGQNHSNMTNEANIISTQKRLQTILASQVEAVVEADKNYSVYVIDLNTQEKYFNYYSAMPSASMIKMFILAKAFEDISAGKLLLSEEIILRGEDIVGGSGNIQGLSVGTPMSIRYLLEKMIVDSDNIATNLLINRLGMDEINFYISANGYTDTCLQRYMMDFEAQSNGYENYTSTRDLALIFAKLYAHQCISEEADKAMIDILAKQTDNDKIPAGLPMGTVFAHKTGELPNVYNDGGIVYTKQADYVIVVMSQAVSEKAIEVLGRISAVIYENIVGLNKERVSGCRYDSGKNSSLLVNAIKN